MPTLSETLSELARLLPERVKLQTDEKGNQFWYVWVRLNGGHWALIGSVSKHHALLPTEPGAVSLQLAMCQECEARGWEWRISRSYMDYNAEVWPVATKDGHYGDSTDSAAHALASALAQALEARQ